MIESLQQAGKADLLPLGYAFSALMFKEADEQQWLQERLHQMEHILEKSWAYQEMVQKGVTKGLAQGLKQGKQQGLEQGLKQGKQQGLEQAKKAMEPMVVRFVEVHFPDLVLLAKQQVALTTTFQQLQEMLALLLVAHTEDEVRAILLGQR